MSIASNFSMLKWLTLMMVLIPSMGSCGLIVWSFFGLPWREAWIERLTRTIMVFLGLGSLILVWSIRGPTGIPFYYGDVLTFASSSVGINLRIDALALIYLITSGFIAAVVGYFSARYLHRDPGYYRFFTLYLLFVAGLNAVSLAGGLFVFVAGWEFVGLSSVLLVGFYRERRGPVNGATTVFTAYRLGDIGIHGLTMLLPFWLGRDLFPSSEDLLLASNVSLAWVASILILWAAACKSAQGPFSLWLPRAMEGPTPSSAIFYGALSVHLGVLLLLRTAPIWRSVEVMPWCVGALGLFTAAYGASVGRTRSDIKSLLAYASMAQVGLIFFEVSLGWDRWALWHMVGHATLRTLQFLRAPSAISDWMRFGRPQGWRERTRKPLESRFRKSLEIALYRSAFSGWGLHILVEKIFVRPVMQLAKQLAHWSTISSQRLDGWRLDDRRRCSKGVGFETSSHPSGSAPQLIANITVAFISLFTFICEGPPWMVLVGWILPLGPVMYLRKKYRDFEHQVVSRGFLMAQIVATGCLLLGFGSQWMADSGSVATFLGWDDYSSLHVLSLWLFLLASLLRQGVFPFHVFHKGWYERAPLTSILSFLAVPAGILLFWKQGAPLLHGLGDDGLSPWVWLWTICLVLTGILSVAQKNLRSWLGMAQSFLALLLILFLGGFAGASSPVVGNLLLWLMVSGGVSMAFVLWRLEMRVGPLDPGIVRGIANSAPTLAMTVLLVGLSMVGLPLTLGYVAEDAWLHTLHHIPLMGTILIIFGYVLLGVGFFRLYTQIFWGPCEGPVIEDFYKSEKIFIFLMLLPLIVGGTMPLLLGYP